MRTFDLLVPCHFGLEAVLKREIYDLGYEITKVEDGRVTFEGDEEGLRRRLLKNFSRESRTFRGKNIFRRMESSG